MHPLQVAARFAAFTWYTTTHPEAEREDAAWFSRTNWADFLPAVNEGLGRLLLKITAHPTAKARKSKKPVQHRRSAARAVCA